MKKGFRITRSTDFKRVRRFGKSYAHPLVVLVTARNQETNARVGVVAGVKVGGAVVRNRAKRQIRAVAHDLLPKLTPGWDLIFIARQPISAAQYQEIEQAMGNLVRRAGLVEIDRYDGERAARSPG